MYAYRQSLTIERPAEAVWPYLAALELVPQWDTSVLDLRVISPKPVHVGSQVGAERVFLGQPARLHGHVREWKDGRLGSVALRGGPILELVVTCSLKPTGHESCVVTYAVTGRVAGWPALLGPLMPIIGRWEARQHLGRLRRRILSGIPPNSSEPTPDRVPGA